MNSITSLSKKDLFRQEDEIPRLILENSPANILKSARESLKNLDSNKPRGQNKRNYAHLKLPQTSSSIEEVATAKLRPSSKCEPLETVDRLRAKSAFDPRMALVQDGNKKTTIFTGETEVKPGLSALDTNLSDNTDQKPQKLFIIKHKKTERNGSRQGTNELGEPVLSPNSSPTNSKLSHIPHKFSSFKLDSSRHKSIIMIEEKKSESGADTNRTGNSRNSKGIRVNGESPTSQVGSLVDIKVGSRTELRDSHRDRYSEDSTNGDVINMSPQEESKTKRNSVILKKDRMVNFNVKLGEVLGEGAYGVVYKALNMETGQFVAVKHIKLEELQNKSSVGLENFCHEIEVYQKLEHENIVPYLGAKQEGEDIYIYMEYMPGGSISSMLKQYGSFQEKVIRKFTRHVVQGLHYLHQKGVIHRDVKGGNILSDGSGNVKLADFGASKHIENISFVSSISNSEGNHIVNTQKLPLYRSLFWMAPELMNNEKHGRKIDIWSLGCTVIEMATGKHPWPNVQGLPQLIVAVMTKKCPPIPEHLSDTAKDFIQKCCQFDKKLRPRTEQLLEHPFLTEDL